MSRSTIYLHICKLKLNPANAEASTYTAHNISVLLNLSVINFCSISLCSHVPNKYNSLFSNTAAFINTLWVSSSSSPPPPPPYSFSSAPSSSSSSSSSPPPPPPPSPPPPPYSFFLFLLHLLLLH